MHCVLFIAMVLDYTWKPGIHVLCQCKKLDIYKDYYYDNNSDLCDQYGYKHNQTERKTMLYLCMTL